MQRKAAGDELAARADAEALVELLERPRHRARGQAAGARDREEVVAGQDLREELATAETAMRDLQPRREIELHVPGEPVPVRADSGRLLQVLMNLFENAVNSSPPETPITLDLEVDEASAAVSVTDRGAGLSTAEAESMFDKFVRGRSSTRGSGLGLFLVREIITAHGGIVSAHPAEGGGTTFMFRVPLAR